MIHRKRGEATSKINGNAADNEGSHEEVSKGKKGATGSTTTLHRGWLMSAAGTACYLLAAAAAWHNFLSTLAFLRIVTLAPVAVCLYQGLFGKFSSSDGSSRYFPLALVATVVTAQFPAFLGTAVAALGVLFFSLVTLPLPSVVAPLSTMESTNANAATAGNNGTHDSVNNHHDNDHDKRPIKKIGPGTMVLAVVALVTILLTDNFFVWVVSATFEPGWRLSTAPTPLQDNGRNMIQFILQDLTKHQAVGLRRLWNVQWCLVACLGVAFFIVQVYQKYPGRRQLYSMCTRAVVTLATARLIRVVSFCLTVMPSQNKACYGQHFPFPPPNNWMDWLAVGLKPASNGGCNDLIVSGHATVTATMACVASSVAMSGSSIGSGSSRRKKDHTFATCLWIMVFLDYCIEIYEGFHYAVDMWLGMVLVVLLWNALAPLEESDHFHENNDEDDKDKSSNKSPSVGFSGTMKDIGVYSLPAVSAYLQLTVMPQFTANLLIVVYVIVASVVYSLSTNKSSSVADAEAYQHYAQHVLLCTLMVALGVYL
jgi:hypothetical protein